MTTILSKTNFYILIFFWIIQFSNYKIFAEDSKLLSLDGVGAEEKIAKLSLEEIEELATKSNPLYLQEKTNIGAARGDTITASLYYNPIVGLQRQFIGASRNSGPGLSETYMTLQQPVDLNGVIPQRKKVALQDFQVSLAKFSDFDRLFRLRLRQNYWSYLYLTELVKFQAEFLENYKDLLELTKFRAEKGDISWLEYERIELERIQLEREYKNTRIERARIGKDLRILIGIRNPQAVLNFVGKLEFKSTSELKVQLDSFDPEKRPDYLALQYQESRERQNVELKKREAFPTLTIGGELMNKGQENYSGVYASIPLPVFDRKQGEIYKAEEIAKGATLNLESKKVEINSEIFATKRELLVREEQLLDYRKIDLLNKNREVQEKSRLAYIRGASNLVTFLEAERNFLNVLRTYYELIYLYYNAIDQYKAAIGNIGPQDNQSDKVKVSAE
ncbi:TolC family protein [Leptospira sp. GIMC2001]|uniref:TolC family protein n=1 Tax=Leptospira sp. GIMC2001 TaxID=1513297 RepID=UPI00234A7F4C|nr:TolC family protein [Leptospira sp. GIMC2001]WCL48181.1 TolC family protein [Leptospira sp. GIMC2001]